MSPKPQTSPLPIFLPPTAAFPTSSHNVINSVLSEPPTGVGGTTNTSPVSPTTSSDTGNSPSTRNRSSTPAQMASHTAPELSPQQSATMANTTFSSQTSRNQSTAILIPTSVGIQRTSSATSSTLISSVILPTTNTRNASIHNHSRSWILPMAVTISSILIGVSMIVLYVHRTRRRKKLREMLVPAHVDFHDPTPFILSQEIFSRYTNPITKIRGSEKVAETPSASTADRQGQKKMLGSSRGTNRNQIKPSTIVEMPMNQNDGLFLGRVARTEDEPVDPNDPQRRTLLVEALQERLRLVEDIALRSVHNPQREGPRNLERELRELIPPPDYTTTFN